MTNEEFFDALDLDRPTLAAVRDAVEKGDMAGAQAAFVAHLKTRDSPRWHIDWRSRPANPDPSVPASGRRRIADDALEHRFTVCGLPHRFEGEIDWAFNPTADPAAGHALNHEWTWQFSRHPFWGSLGRAYWETGDERYVREFVAEMTHWVEQNPVPEPDADQGPYSRWRTIEAGIRMGGSWPDAFHLGLSSPSFSDGAVVTMVRSMTEHARYLKAHPTTRNWLTMEMSGLFTVGALFPEFREAREWRDTAARRMREELDEQVYPDGAQKELAPGYHWVALLNFRRILTLAQLNDYALPEGYKASLERMYDYILWMSTPDRALPPFNDSGHRAGYALGPLREAVEDFPAREEFRYVVTDGKEGTSPGRTSCAFPWAGHVVQRSGWDRDARYLAFDAGPFGAGHQHEDKLNFVLMAYGRELVVEGGVYMYDASQWRRYVLGPYAHNVAFIDGKGQHRRGIRETYETDAELPFIWRTTDAYDYVQASYGGEMEGFGEDREWIATHTRRVLFVKRGDGDAGAPGDFWVLLDTFRPRDKDSHRYECVFHLDAPAVEVDETTRSVVTRHEEGTNLGIFPLGTEGLEVTVIEGQEEPFVQGWLPLRTASMTGVRPIPTPVFSVEGAGEVRMACVFVPVPQGSPNVSVKPWRLDTLETDDGLGLEITSRDGLRLLALFPEDHSQTWNGLGHSFSGPVWVAEEANGAWQRVAP